MMSRKSSRDCFERRCFAQCERQLKNTHRSVATFQYFSSVCKSQDQLDRRQSTLLDRLMSLHPLTTRCIQVVVVHWTGPQSRKIPSALLLHLSYLQFIFLFVDFLKQFLYDISRRLMLCSACIAAQLGIMFTWRCLCATPYHLVRLDQFFWPGPLLWRDRYF